MQATDAIEKQLAELNHRVGDRLTLTGQSLSQEWREQTANTHSEIGAATLAYRIRWRWHDQISESLDEYVQSLLAIAQTHHLSEIRGWVQTQIKRNFQFLVLRNSSQLHRSEERTFRAAGASEPEPDILKALRLPATREMRAELLITGRDLHLRIPVAVPAHFRFLISESLDGIEAKLAEADGTANTPVKDPLWTFQRSRLGWSVGTRSQLLQFRDSLGFFYLQSLLRTPDQEVSVQRLVELARTIGASRQNAADAGELSDEEAGFEVLDAQAVKEYRVAIKALQRDAEIAAQLQDTERLSKIHEEVSFYAAELRRATGLRGRRRIFSRKIDSQRVAVRKATSKSLKLIAEGLPEIGEHLEASIKFGTHCCYKPIQHRQWRFD